MSRNAGREISRRSSLQKGGIVLTGAVLGLSSTSTSAAAEPTEINECTSISEPGEYVLTEDLEVEDGCFGLRGSDIILDGSGHTISGDGTGNGVSVEGTPVVRNLTIENFETGCFIARVESEIILENTVVSDTSVGITGFPKVDMNIQGSTIKDNGTGIAGNEAFGITITGSILSGNESAVTTDLGNFMEVENSTVIDNGTGIEAGEGTFVNNTITGNDGFGLRLIGLVAPTDLGSATIVGNEIQGNAGPGIEFTSSSGDVRENMIADNQIGILLSGFSPAFGFPQYEFTRNDIRDNDEFGIRNESDQPAVASCNYWGHPTGPVHPENPFKNPKGDKVDGDVEFIPWSVAPIRDGEATCIGGRRIKGS